MEELKNIVNEMVKDNAFMNSEEKLKHYVNKYPKISNEYPMLIKKACEPNFDIQRFKWMLDMIDNVKSNNITQHDASVKVGEHLVDEYVKPLL